MAETKKKGRIFDLPETKGLFQLKGIVTGTEKDKFYKEIKTRSNKDMRIVNFGVTYDEDSTLYVNIQGMEHEDVYFSKKSEKKSEKKETVKVPWVDRYTYKREGFKLIGKDIGVRKKLMTKEKQSMIIRGLLILMLVRKLMTTLKTAQVYL